MADYKDNPQKFDLDQRLKAARDVIALQAGVSPSETTVSAGREQSAEGGNRISFAERVRPNAATSKELIFRMHVPGLDLEEPRLIEEIRTKLAQLKPLEVVEMMPEEKQVEKVKTDLKAATAGTDFNQKLIDDASAINAELAKDGVNILAHALQNASSTAFGVEAELRFPSKTREEQAPLLQKNAELIRGRLNEIKEIELDRVLKYTRINMTARGLNAEETSNVKTKAEAESKTPEQVQEALKQALEAKIEQAQAKVRTDFAKLNYSVNTRDNALVIEIRSPEQIAALEKARASNNEWQDPAQADDLRNTNPLTSLVVGLTTTPTPATDTKPEVSPQLHKLLARSVLFDKQNNPIPDFPKLAGRKDLQIAIIKEMMRVLKQLQAAGKEEELKIKTEAFSKIINSELFKNHDHWFNEPGKADVAKLPASFTALPGDMLEIAFTLQSDKDPAKNQLLQVVQGLAELGKQPPKETALAQETPPAVVPTAAPAQPAATQSPAAIANDIMARNPSFMAQVNTDKATVAASQARG